MARHARYAKEGAVSKIRVVVEMHGGTIQSVYPDSGQELDVVFTEAPKYLDNEDDMFEVKGNAEAGDVSAGDCVYCHHGCTQVSKEALDPAFEAARKRIKAAKEEAEGCAICKAAAGEEGWKGHAHRVTKATLHKFKGLLRHKAERA